MQFPFINTHRNYWDSSGTWNHFSSHQCLPPAWPLLRSQSLHKGTQASSGLPQRTRNQTDNIHRRYTDYGPISRFGPQTSLVNTGPTRVTGLPDKLSKMHHSSNSDDRFPGFPGRLERTEALPSFTEDVHHHRRSRIPIEMPTRYQSRQVGENDRPTQWPSYQLPYTIAAYKT